MPDEPVFTGPYVQIGGGLVFSFDISPDGSRLVVGRAGGVYLLDTQTLQPVWAYQTNAAVLDVAYSHDGKSIAAGIADGELILWDTKDLESPRILSRADTPVSAVDFSTVGHFLASGDERGSIVLWDTQTWKPVRTIADCSPIIDLEFDPTSLWLASGTGNLDIWNSATGAPVHQFHHAATHVAWSRDGTQVGGSWTGTVNVWDSRTWVNTFTVAAERVFGDITFDPSGNPVWFIPGRYQYSADGSKLYGFDRDYGIIDDFSVRDTASNQYSLIAELSGVLSNTILVNKGQQLATLTDDQVAVWDTHTGQKLRGWSDPDQILTISADPSGKMILTGLRMHGSAMLWDSQTGRTLGRFDSPYDEVGAVALSADGSMVAGVAMKVKRDFPGDQLLDSAIVIWDRQSGQIIHTFRPDEEQRPYWDSIRFGPGDQTIISEWFDKIQTWDIATGAFSQEARKPPESFDFKSSTSPDGRLTVTAKPREEKVVVTETASGKVVWSQPGYVSDVLWSPDSRRIIVVGYDQVIRIWDIPEE